MQDLLLGEAAAPRTPVLVRHKYRKFLLVLHLLLQRSNLLSAYLFILA